ncbi:MAG: serine/threonine-protein phosphatase [Myxococcales bacterium]|nr:serine/threonine-protein phosphatase [Myxococcales bacterium]
MACSIGLVCDIGVGPGAGGRDRNEDNFLVCDSGEIWYRVDDQDQRLQQDGEGVLLVVCDGMGGHTDGHVASTAAVRVMAKLYQPGAPKRVARVLQNYVMESHRALHRAARRDGPVSMGTTLTAAWVVGHHCAWLQVGDSRLYLARDQQLFRLTADQTRNEFARRDGRPISPRGDHLAQNFIFGSRGLGDDLSLRLDKGLDCGTEPLQKGDGLLLCSDGISGVLADEEMAEIVASSADPQSAVEGLRARALERGSTDNVTALLVRFDDLPQQGESADWLDDPEETVQF